MTRLLNHHEIETIVSFLELGKLVAIPTDTVYGLAVLASHDKAIQRLKQVKNREAQKPFAYMVDDLHKIEEVCELTERDRFLIKEWLPGPITFIFNKKENNLIIDQSDVKTLAIRIPDHPLILDIIKELKVGLYVPSANKGGQPPAIDGQEVFHQLKESIDGIVIGESLGQAASTIIDASQETLKIVREGPISLSQIEESLGDKA